MSDEIRNNFSKLMRMLVLEQVILMKNKLFEQLENKYERKKGFNENNLM